MTPSATSCCTIRSIKYALAMHLSMGPLPFIDTTIWPGVDPWAMFLTIEVLTFIGSSARPRHMAISSHLPGFEGSWIDTTIGKPGRWALTSLTHGKNGKSLGFIIPCLWLIWIDLVFKKKKDQNTNQKLVDPVSMHLVCLKAPVVGSTLGRLVEASPVLATILKRSTVEASICP